jgi:hypothetical protein
MLNSWFAELRKRSPNMNAAAVVVARDTAGLSREWA